MDEDEDISLNDSTVSLTDHHEASELLKNMYAKRKKKQFGGSGTPLIEPVYIQSSNFTSQVNLNNENINIYEYHSSQ